MLKKMQFLYILFEFVLQIQIKVLYLQYDYELIVGYIPSKRG